MLRKDVHRPADLPPADAGALVGQIDLFRVIGAGFLCRAAVQTAQGAARRGVFRPEVEQRAKGGYPLHAAAAKPDQVVQIVAALCQDHRAGLVLAPPVSAHEAVRLVPVDDVLQRLNIDDLTQPALVDHTLDRAEKRGVAQHVADHHAPPGLAGDTDDLLQLGKGGRDRLFQQNVVALAHGGDRLRHVLPVLGADAGDLRQARLGEQLLGAGIAHSGADAEGLAADGQPLGVRVGNGRDLCAVRHPG